MKRKFLEIYNSRIKRDGKDKLLEWLERSDFFTAPASTRFHLSEPCGLLKHSLNVYERLRELALREKERKAGAPSALSDAEEEKIAICGLLHDICKANFYGVEYRNRKNEDGQWEKYACYKVEDQFPFGHGEKSVVIVSWFMRLSAEEMMAIRWHMGGFDDAVRGGSYALNGAYEKFPFAVLLNLADMMATYLDEGEETTQ